MRKAILILLCILLLVIPISAETSRVRITTYDAVCTVDDAGNCDVTLTLSVEFPTDAASFLIPLPLGAENITATGLMMSQSSAEDRILLVVQKQEGFEAAEVLTISYRLPQLVESWDNKQTFMLPLLLGDWNCEIAYYQMHLNFRNDVTVKPVILDADGDTMRNFLTVTAEGSQLTLESSGKAFSPKTATLEAVFTGDFFPSAAGSSAAEIADVTQISTLDVACSVLEDSSCSVTMTANYTFCDSPTELQIPVPSEARNVTLGGMRFATESSSGCKLLVLSDSSGFSGTQTLTVSYRLAATAVEDSDGQLLTLPLIYAQWNYPIRSFSLSLTMPAAFEGLPEFVSSYFNEQIDNYLNIQTDGELLTVKSLQPLMEKESLTVRLSLPDGFFDLRFQKGLFATAETVLFWVALVLCVLYWFFFLRIRLRSVVPESRAPLGCNAGQIPYLLQLKEPSFGLMIAAWASLGYVTLSRSKSRHVTLNRRMDMRNERSRSEMLLFSDLFARTGSCPIHTRTYKTAAKHCAELTAADWQSRLKRSRQKRGKAWPLKLLALLVAVAASVMVFDSMITPQSFRWLLILPLAFLAVLGSLQLQKAADLHFARHKRKARILIYALALGLLILGAVSGCFGTVLLNCLLQYLVGVVLLPGVCRSASGVSVFYQLLGLRKYLKALDASDLETMLRRDPQYYYRVLPYAEALGIGNAFTKKFAGLQLEPCHWLNWKDLPLNTAEEFYPRFCRMLDELDAVEQNTSLLHKIKKAL